MAILSRVVWTPRLHSSLQIFGGPVCPRPHWSFNDKAFCRRRSILVLHNVFSARPGAKLFDTRIHMDTFDRLCGCTIYFSRSVVGGLRSPLFYSISVLG